MRDEATKNDGGPAFPVATAATVQPPGMGQYVLIDGVHAGMTLRDWFAGQTLAGISADPTVVDSHTTLAQWSYEMADAMIAQREKR